MKRRLPFFLALVLVLSLALGCAQVKDQADKAKDQAEEGKENLEEQVEQLTPEQMRDAIEDEWAESGHAKAVNADDPESPAKRDGCLVCHNGNAYQKQVSTMAELKDEEVVGQNCETCHQGHGKEVRDEGSTDIPNGTVAGGQGALCMNCHNARKLPDPGKHPAPHAAAEADMLAGVNGAEIMGKVYLTSAHATLKETCIHCHMAELKGYPSHTFEAAVEACNKCHDDFDTLNPKARGDYDGDGTVKGIQDEVAGLLEKLKETVEEQLKGGTFESNHGKVVFKDKEGNVHEKIPSEDAYAAAWNYFLVKNDGSLGMHNPVYAVQLLQQTILAMGGDLGDADIR